MRRSLSGGARGEGHTRWRLRRRSAAKSMVIRLALNNQCYFDGSSVCLLIAIYLLSAITICCCRILFLFAGPSTIQSGNVGSHKFCVNCYDRLLVVHF